MGKRRADGPVVDPDVTEEPLATTLYLLEMHRVTLRNIQAALAHRDDHRPCIGELAIRERMLTPKQVLQILDVQADGQELFGDIAIRLGLLSRSQVLHLLGLQMTSQPSLAESLRDLGIIDDREALECLDFVQQRRARVEPKRPAGRTRPPPAPLGTPP